MRSSPMVVLSLLLTGALLLSIPARADEGTPVSDATSTDNSTWGLIQKKGKLSYLAWFQGMRTEALSGNGGPGKEGKGTNFEVDHYFSAGWKTGQYTSVRMTQMAQEFIVENKNGGPEKKKLQPYDPYFTFSHGRILHSDRYAANLEGYLRYYAPLSLNSRNALNKGFATAPDDGDNLNMKGPNDTGYGQMRVYLNPSKSFLDGKLTFNGAALTNIKFASLSPQERFDRQNTEFAKKGSSQRAKSYREDLYVLIDPSVAYSVSSKVDVYLEAATLWRHSTDGHWTSSNDPDDGWYISPGIYWSPTKKVYVNPYVSYQISAQESLKSTPQYQGIGHMDVGLQLQYTFL